MHMLWNVVNYTLEQLVVRKEQLCITVRGVTPLLTPLPLVILNSPYKVDMEIHILDNVKGSNTCN